MSEQGNARRSLAQLMDTMAEEVAPQVRGEGPAAARRRGHVRTVRQRIALCCLAVLVGVAGAAVVSGRGHTAAPVPATSPSPSAARPTADRNTPDAAAWLTPDQLPFAVKLHWRQDDSPNITVEPEPEDRLGVCLSGDTTAYGAFRTYQQGPPWYSGPDITVEQIYSVQLFYANESAAVHGLALITAAYGSCQGVETTGAGVIDTVKTTASGQGRLAILRTVRKPDGSSTSTATVNSDSHEYVVQDGTVIYFVGVYGDSVIDAAGTDPQILQAMHDALEQYQK